MPEVGDLVPVDEVEPRCGGSGELVWVDGPRDRVTGEWAREEWFECFGCLDCAPEDVARDLR